LSKPSKTDKHFLIYSVAGEASGDQVGAKVIAVLRDEFKDNIRFEGVGGTAMDKQGLKSLFPMTELSVMGLLEIIPHLPNVYLRMHQTLDDVKRLKPNLLLTIDSPGFNFHLARKVKKLGIPCVHYSGPTVWAWRANRAKKIAQYLDHLLVFFPFEPPYFTREGLACTFTGHPLIEKKLDELSPKAFLKRHNIAARATVLCVLPGSRQGELKRHLPIFLDTIEILRQNNRDLVLIFPTLVHLRPKIEQALAERCIPGIVVSDDQQKYEAMRAATAALAASGTVTLELGLCGTPMVVAYKVNTLTAFLVKKMMLVEHVSLVNILLKERVVSELLQHDCHPTTLAEALKPLLVKRSKARRAQITKLQQLKKLISPDKGTPSENAAIVIGRLLKGETI
jgi:lipid-A-disaccharide synthase